MANRRELLTAVNLTINTNRVNDAMWWMENALQNIDINTGQSFVLREYTPMPGEDPPPQLTLEQQVKKNLKAVKKNLKVKTKVIKKVLGGAPQSHVLNGLGYAGILESDIEYDATESGNICEIDDINLVGSFPEMLTHAPPFIAYQYRLMKTFTPENLPKQVNDANIVNSIIDAMAWELKGLNENTGDPHGRIPEQFDKLIANRIFTAEIHLSHLSDTFEDVADLRSAVAYVKQFYKVKGNSELAGYLDANISKNISIRKAWSL